MNKREETPQESRVEAFVRKWKFVDRLAEVYTETLEDEKEAKRIGLTKIISKLLVEIEKDIRKFSVDELRELPAYIIYSINASVIAKPSKAMIYSGLFEIDTSE